MRGESWVICFLLFDCIQISVSANAQDRGNAFDSINQIIRSDQLDYKKQTDLIDLGMLILHRNPERRLGNNDLPNTKLKISAGPIMEYMMATGFAGGMAINGAFLTKRSATNLSSVLLAVKYTQRKQFLLPIQSSVWLPNNKYYFLGDWRYLNYPQDTYGFGGSIPMKNVFTVTYKYIRFYEFVFRKIFGNLYGGGGYRIDDHWGISQTGIPSGEVTDFTKYGYTRSSVSSGVTLNLLYDSRRNSINPVAGGFYANFEFQQNAALLGSNTNWNSVLIDVRKYIGLAPRTILAFWSYSVITLHGNPPFLDLPGTGSDTYNNTGRGYEQNRFVGKKMIDLEAELRFPITKDGLIGAVIFTNAESFSELNDKFKTISFAAGAGLRIKFNKFSNANACIDYGVGKGGSHSFFGNLGEVF